MSSENALEVKVPDNIENEHNIKTENVNKIKSIPPDLVASINKIKSEEQLIDEDNIMLTLEALNSPSDDTSRKMSNLEEKKRQLIEIPTDKKTSTAIVKTNTNGSDTNSNVNKIKPAPRLLNKEVAAKNNATKRLNNKFNSAKPINSNEDLVAILEGKNPNDSETEEYQLLDLMQNEDDHNVENINETSEDKSSVVTLMTKEEERKIALAQMSNFSSKKAKNLQTRKIKSPATTTELVTLLASDWSDGEKDPDIEYNKKEKIKTVPTKKAVIKKDNIKSETIDIITSTTAPTSVTSSSNVTISTITSTGIVPFKRSRIIKKKIIWDPDAPETQFSYASLIKKTTPKQDNKKIVAIKKTVETVSKKIEKSAALSPTSTTPIIKIEASNSSSPIKGKKITASQPLVKVAPVEPTKVLNGKKRKASTTTNTISTTTGTGVVTNSEQKSHSPVKVISSIEIKSNTPKIAKVDKTVEPELHPVPAPEKPTKKENVITTGKKRGPNKTKPSTASTSWDYVYKQQTEDAMIIRRRSNSSYSSTTSPRRLSLEQQIPATSIKKTTAGIKTGVKRKQDNFQFAKPENKKNGRGENNLSNNSIVVDIKKQPGRKSSRTSSTIADVIEAENITSSSIPTTCTTQPELIDKNSSEITVKKIGKIGQIILNPRETKVKNCFSSMLMNKIISHLDALEKDNNCKIVVISSKTENFCQGIDISSLIGTTVDKRKLAAQDLSKSLKNFIESLASFPKPLVASVSGSLKNLGVTILPLFDIVICSEKTSFETTYTKIGQIPEGYCILSKFNLITHSSIKKMLYLCEKLNATDAYQSDLITKLTQSDKVDDEAIEIAKKMSLLSHQTYSTMKAQRKRIDFTELSKLLDEEQKLLIQHWISAECQEKFKEYIKNEQW